MTEHRKQREVAHSQQLPTPDDSRVLSNNESLNEEQTDQFNSDDYIQDQTPKIIIPKENMKTLFTKLASNGHLRTLKDKSINPESLILKESYYHSKDMKIFDSKLNIDEYIMNDPNLLLTDTFINKVNTSSSPNKKQTEAGFNNINTIDSFNVQSNESITKHSSLDNSLQMAKNNNITNKQFNPIDSSIPIMTDASSSNGNLNSKGIHSQKKSVQSNKSQSTSNANNNTNTKGLQSTRTPTKRNQTKTMTANGKKSIQIQAGKQTIVTSNSKKEIVDNSINNNTNTNNNNNNTNNKNALKRKVASPSSQMMSSSKKNKPKQSVASPTNTNGTEMNIIEEYDYNKILSDLKAIFGDNLEYFDENLLFSNLDEATNKGLIKGLLMLSYFQEKKLKTMNENMTKAKNQFQEELNKKDTIIDEMSHDFVNINTNLKGCKQFLYNICCLVIGDTDKYNIYNKKSHNVNGNNKLNALFDKCK